MRAFVVVHARADLEPTLEYLQDLQADSDFCRETGCFVESVQVAFGTAHFSLIVYAGSRRGIVDGLRRIRSGLQSLSQDGPDDPFAKPALLYGAVTSTVIGWIPEDDDIIDLSVKLAAAGITDDHKEMLRWLPYLTESLNRLERFLGVLPSAVAELEGVEALRTAISGVALPGASDAQPVGSPEPDDGAAPSGT